MKGKKTIEEFDPGVSKNSLKVARALVAELGPDVPAKFCEVVLATMPDAPSWVFRFKRLALAIDLIAVQYARKEGKR